MTILACGLFPLSLIAYVYFFVEPTLIFKSFLFHEIAIGVAVTWSAAITYIAYQCYLAKGETFLRYMTLAFLGQTIIYSMHGLLTRTAVDIPILFILYGPASRVVMAFFLSAALLKYGTDILDHVERKVWIFWISVFVLILPMVALLAVSPVGTNFYVRAAMETLSIVMYLAALFIIFLRKINTPLMWLYSAALTFFALSSFAFILVKMPWNQMFWLAHVIFASGFLVLSYGLVQARKRSSSFAELFDEDLLYAQLAEEVSKQKKEIKTREKAEAALHAAHEVLEKRVEERTKRFQESEARLAEILQIAPEAVIAVGANMDIQLFNQGAERIFGYKAKEVLGQPLEILMPEYFHKHHRTLVDEFNRSGETYRLMDRRNEILGLKKDGAEFPATASVSKLETGGEIMYTVMLRDNTERKQTEEVRERALVQAEQANQAKSEFLASMSHDLRTPLNAIQGFSEMLEGQYFGPLGSEKYQEYAGDIRTSSQYLLSLVEDILDLSVIEANRRKMVQVPLLINNVIRDFSPFINDAARRKNIEYHIEAPDDTPVFFADRRALTQILVNLLSNAVKFTPEGGKVTLRVSATNGATIFEVNDTGRGIPKDKIATLTDPFVRTETDPHLAQEGIGLGLTIVKSLVDLHDGELDIESTVGKGTSCTVTLPSTGP